jgi:hypothetical protein
MKSREGTEREFWFVKLWISRAINVAKKQAKNPAYVLFLYILGPFIAYPKSVANPSPMARPINAMPKSGVRKL